MIGIHTTIQARANELGLTAYGIAIRCDHSPNPESVKRFLDGKTELGSDKLAKVMEILGLEITTKR